MLKIVIGGQLSKKENAELVEKYGEGKVEISVMGDLQAAMAVKNKKADYYFVWFLSNRCWRSFSNGYFFTWL